MLEYQKQDCDLTLQEGLECYYKSFPESTEVFMDTLESGTLMRDHDCTHVIFGLDISLEQEAILDSWVLWGSKWKLKYLLGYYKLPKIKQLTKDLFKELGILGFLKLYWRVSGIKRKVIFRAFKMKKKWPFKVPEEYLSMKISDLRKEYGIDVLPEEEMKSIELDLSDDVLLKLAMQAHERNVTLNTHIIDVIKDKLKDTEYQFENGDKPQLLTERQT